MHISNTIQARKDGNSMDEMTSLIKNFDYITPKLAEKFEISKFKFYKYVRENRLKQVSHGVYSI